MSIDMSTQTFYVFTDRVACVTVFILGKKNHDLYESPSSRRSQLTWQCYPAAMGGGSFLPCDVRQGESLRDVVGEGSRWCQGGRSTIQGIDISVSSGNEYVGVIGTFSDGLSRLLYLPMVHV